MRYVCLTFPDVGLVLWKTICQVRNNRLYISSSAPSDVAMHDGFDVVGVVYSADGLPQLRDELGRHHAQHCKPQNAYVSIVCIVCRTIRG